ncbi:MAG: redoxin family protein [Beijerinckiaceae bacterium]
MIEISDRACSLSETSSMEGMSRRAAIAATLALGATVAGCNGTPSAPLPETVNLPPVPGARTPMGSQAPGLIGRVFRGEPAIVNVWASWCPYCRSEHELLNALGRDPRIRLLGILRGDDPAKAADYLRQAGNPYRALGVDQAGFAAKHLRPRGVPATYVVDPLGRIVAHLPGALSPERVESELRPAYQRARTLTS